MRAHNKISFGQTAFLIVSIVALFATSNTVLILLIVNSRMIYGMARDAKLPPALSKISRRGTPWLAILTVLILSSVFVLLGNLELVAEITNFGIFVTFASVNLSAIWLRYRQPDLERPFKTPIALANIPIIPLIGLLSCGLLITQLRVEVVVLGAVILLLGTLFQKVWRDRR